MVALLHGYLLEGSGSNLWTRSIIQSMCASGETVHLMCQENHPDLYDFICKAIIYHENGEIETILNREPVYPGKCIMHKPKFGDTLPVYVPDKYEEYPNPVPMIHLDDTVIDNYLEANIKVLNHIVEKYQVIVIHANHAVLMSVVAQQVADQHKIPYAIMPHGSAIEFTVKKDKRFFDYAEHAFNDAQRIYVIGKEIRSRVKELFPTLPEVESKMMELNLGVNTSLFNPVKADKRHDTMIKLFALLKNVPRGKSNLDSHNMISGLTSDTSKQKLLEIIQDTSHYNGKLTDDNVEGKLNLIDWDNDKIILFVGRLITSKGLHSIVTALPEILETEPKSRLIVVGHGPQREPLEAFIWALQNGHKELALNIVDWGIELEGNGDGPWEETKLYFDSLRRSHKLDSYFEKAQKSNVDNRIVFTGYLTHRELCYLFPVCDVAVFPSVVAEAGPLVFLEAMASGCFPIGTYFAGMGASIDSVSDTLPEDIVDLMKLSPEADQTVLDIINNVKKAFYVDDKYKGVLREVAIEKYDWKNISKKLDSDLHQLVF